MAPIKLQQVYIRGTRDTVIGPQSYEPTTTYDALDISDSSPSRADKAFQSTHIHWVGSLAETDPPDFWITFHQWPTNFYRYYSTGLDLADDDGSRMNRLLATSNPATPEILIPVFWFELKDLPDMIRQGGRLAHAILHKQNWRNLIRKGKEPSDWAAANLALQFGWLPFLSDLKQIATFQSSVDKTKKKFEQLSSGKGLRVRMPLGKAEDEFPVSWPLNSDINVSITAAVTVKRVTTSWGVARWKPQVGVTLPSSNADFRRRALGLTPDAVAIEIWEAMPWSWLIDYFVNIGNMLQANNRCVAIPVSGTVMTQKQVTATHDPIKVGPHQVSAGVFTNIIRERATIFSTSRDPLSFLSYMRVLQPAQLSILGSLFLTRHGPRKS
jgi:hypothetical protein